MCNWEMWSQDNLRNEPGPLGKADVLQLVKMYFTDIYFKIW